MRLRQTKLQGREKRPWVEARTCMLGRGNGKPVLTEKMVRDAFEMMRAIEPVQYKYFCTGWARPYLTDEEVIEYFADNGSVIVIDSKNRTWNRGKIMEESV